MEHSGFITILMSVIGALWIILLAVGGYCLKRISDKIDELIVHRQACLMTFADRNRNRDDHVEFFRRTDDHEARIGRLEVRVGMNGGASRE